MTVKQSAHQETIDFQRFKSGRAEGVTKLRVGGILLLHEDQAGQGSIPARYLKCLSSEYLAFNPGFENRKMEGCSRARICAS
jgi:hypothetical protein